MELVVNKKKKQVSFLNKIADYIALCLLILAGLILIFNMANILKALVFIALCGLATYIFFAFGVFGFQLRVFILEAWKELNKIAWPNRKETLQFTWFVFIFVAILSVILWSLDSLISWVLYTFIIGR